MSFTVPLNYWTIAATATVVTSCLFVGRLRGCLSYDVVWWWIFHSWWCLGFGLGQCEADDWKLRHQFLSSTIEFVECVCMLNDWITCNDDFCADNYNSSRFMLKDKCRSEKWELYLYGDMTIQVMESRRAEHCGVLRSCSSWCDGKAFFGPCTQVHGQGFPRHQGGEGVAGTPGACSQVFCHPN